MEEVMGLALFAGRIRAFKEHKLEKANSPVLTGRLKYDMNKHGIKPSFPETITSFGYMTFSKFMVS